MTGRDIIESEYALIAEDGWLWQLDGDSLDAAAARADERRDQAAESAKLEKLGRRSREIVQFVNQRDHVTPANVSARFGMTAKIASNQLNRLAYEGHIVKSIRGEYRAKRYTALNESGESDEFSDPDESEDSASPGNTPQSLDSSRSSHSLHSSRYLPLRNTCGCGVPLTTAKTIERRVCADCWAADQTH